MNAPAGLSPEMTEMVIQTLRQVVGRELPDGRIMELDEKDEFPTATIQKLLSPDVGLHLIFLPAEYGGLGGGARDICRVSEEMASWDLGVATAESLLDRVRREGAEAAKRAERRARTEAVDVALGLTAAWFTDLVAIAEGAPELVRNGDRAAELAADAQGVDPVAAREAAALAMSTRRHLQVNVNEDLALDALFHRAASVLGDVGAVL